MQGIWKLTIKPDARTDRDPFEWCRANGIIGIGWSEFYVTDEPPPSDLAEWLQQTHGSIPGPVYWLLNDMRRGDFVWLMKNGRFFLCRVASEPIVGAAIGKEFREHDIGHARKATWKGIPEAFVPGRVQRSLIVSRALQSISSEPELVDYCRWLHKNATRLAALLDQPPPFNSHVRRALRSLGSDAVRHQLTPDDCEDIVAAMLQTEGWVLVKSSCFRSKADFEFRLLRARGRRRLAYAQVKSGGVQLRPSDYQEVPGDNAILFLFSTADDPYPGPAVRNVKTIRMEHFYQWMVANPSLLPRALALRLVVQSSLT